MEIEPIALIEIEKIKLTLNDFICHKIVVIVPKGRFRSLILVKIITALLHAT